MEKVEPIRDRKKINAIKKILKSNNMRDYCIFTLGINSGLRVSDLLSLHIYDVVDEKLNIQERIRLREKKTGKYRDFPLNEAARKAIQEYLDTRKPFLLDEPLFKSRKTKNGKPMAVQRDIVYKAINAAAREVGISERIGTHTMRKTFGYQAVMSGQPVRYIQKILNHSSEAVTLDYLGITRDDLDDVIFSLNL
jgi:integrase